MSSPSHTDEPATSAFLRLLRRGPFARYMLGESVSMVGTWMQMFAQGWVLTSLSLQAVSLGWLTVCAGVPTLLLAMYGGSVADRWDKRGILLGAIAVQVTLAIGVGWLVQTDQIAVWHLYAVTFVLGIVAAFEMPTVSAFVPELVEKQDLSRALAIDRAVFHFTRMVGPALGGYLIGRYGAPTAYYLNALSFLALAGVILTIRPRGQASAEEEIVRKGPMRAGFDFVRRDVPSRSMILLMASAAMFVSPFFMVTMPVYSRGVLGLDAEHMGTLMAMSGVGSLAGAMLLIVVKRGHRAGFLRLGATLGAVGLAGLAVAPSFNYAAVSMVCMMLGLSTTFGTAHIVIQERAPDAIRGRVSAVASLAFFGTAPFAGLADAFFADHIGLRLAMGIGAGAFAVAALLLLFASRQLVSALRHPVPDSTPPPAE